jgi:PST family polysaccharide transporter
MPFFARFRYWLTHTEYSRLARNASWLSLGHVANYLLPLLTLPYLSRTLGPLYFGWVLMAQSVMMYLSLITDYGFNLSATKDIAENRSNPAAVSQIVSTVLVIKGTLLIISAAILVGLVYAIPAFYEHRALLFLSFLLVVGSTFFPTFIFQGLEKMSVITVMTIAAKGLFTLFIFMHIQSPSDYSHVHALWGLSYIIVDICALAYSHYRCHITLTWPRLRDIVQMATTRFDYFLSRIAIALYLNSNVLLIGLWLHPIQAGMYGGAEKLLFAITTFYTPLIETLYPYISRTKNADLGKKILVIAVCINTLGCLAVYGLAPYLLPLILGDSFTDAVPLFRIMLIIAVLHLPSGIIGYPLLGAMGHTAIANRSVIIGAIGHMLAIVITYPYLTSPLGFIAITIGSQLTILGIRVVAMYRYRLV